MLRAVEATIESDTKERGAALLQSGTGAICAIGGLGKMHQLFGDQMDDLINEINETLVA